MPLIDHIDGPNRDIYLSADTVGAEVHPIDIYKEMRARRRLDENLRKYDLFLEARGNDSKGFGKFTERYVICLNGTRIVPYDTSHTLKVIGTILTDDGQEGIACFDRAPLNAATVVDIDYQPPQVEVITITIGSGLSDEQATMLNELWKLQGLDPAHPMTVTANGRNVDDIDLDFSGDGQTSRTVTRQ